MQDMETVHSSVITGQSRSQSEWSVSLISTHNTHVIQDIKLYTAGDTGQATFQPGGLYH